MYDLDKMNERDCKHAFAELWLRNPTNAYDAAKSLFGGTSPWTHIASKEWIVDPIVLAEKERLLDEFGAKAFLPTKDEFAAMLLAEAELCSAKEDKVKFLKLAADALGYIEKPAINVGNTMNVQHVAKVLVIRDRGSVEEWSRGAIEQQRKLINGSAATSPAT